ncbi:MAG: ComEC/Rec2 family competence protein [Catenisphaera adipataccumulans]|jgi:competence protein ComEC|uniref:ComEC/Rec2 family competence protein n=1 Tax=Catenisphaera adipataccumulans TaxID=700500 RepID=UPI003D8F1E56
MTWLLLCALGTTTLLIIRIPVFMIGFAVGFGIMLMWLYKRPAILAVWIFLSAASFIPVMHQPPAAAPGNYEICEIKPHYCLAQKQGSKILLYGIDSPNYHDVYHVSHVEKFSSLKNIGLFNFEEYLKKQGIEYATRCTDRDLVHSSRSLKSRVYSVLSRNPYYRTHLYGIYDENTSALTPSLGLAVIGFLSLFEYGLMRIVSRRTAQWCTLVLAILSGCLFVFTNSLVRWITFKMGRIFFKEWDRSVSFGVFLFLFLCPQAAGDFAFLLPLCLRLLYRLESDPSKRILYTRMCLFLFQCMYFHSINWVLFLFFPILRSVQGGLLCIAWLFPVETFWQHLLSCLPMIQTHYVPGLLFYLVFMAWLLTRKKSLIFCLLLMPFFETTLDPFFHVYMLDIGQGDCTLLVEPHKKSAVMIDCGQSLYRDNVETIIVPFLRSRQIDHLDALILTHDDYDHSGGAEELRQNIPVDHVITDSYQKIPVRYPFYSLLPDRSVHDENSKSIVSYFSYDDMQYLWTGDADTGVEEQIIKTYDLDVDVLKLGHHGSDTASSYDFLDRTRPILGLVSVGAHNRYNHPSSSVIGRCHDLGIHVLETKDVGMIHIQSFYHFTFFTTATRIFGIISPR